MPRARLRCGATPRSSRATRGATSRINWRRRGRRATRRCGGWPSLTGLDLRSPPIPSARRRSMTMRGARSKRSRASAKRSRRGWPTPKRSRRGLWPISPPPKRDRVGPRLGLQDCSPAKRQCVPSGESPMPRSKRRAASWRGSRTTGAGWQGRSLPWATAQANARQSRRRVWRGKPRRKRSPKPRRTWLLRRRGVRRPPRSATRTKVRSARRGRRSVPRHPNATHCRAR